MLIVAGHFELDPADRDAFLTGRSPGMIATRAEPGCLEYVMSADPIDETRVMLYERWEDQDAFNAHMAALSSGPKYVGPAPKGFNVKIYDIEGVRDFG